MTERDDDERGKPEYDGLRPQEQVGPEDCEADVDRTTVEPDEEPVEPDECDFDTEDALQDAFVTEPIALGIDPVDGMPKPIDGDMSAAFAHPFTYESQLCIEDNRTWVEVFREDLALSPAWGSSRYIVRSRFGDDGRERERERYRPEQVEHRWGKTLVHTDATSSRPSGNADVPRYRLVRPIRERCKYYKRQVTPLKNDPDKQYCHRLCTIRRSNGGAFMTINDTAIFACDFRDPPDPDSTARQNAIDEGKLTTRPHEKLVPMYGMGGDEIDLRDHTKETP